MNQKWGGGEKNGMENDKEKMKSEILCYDNTILLLQPEMKISVTPIHLLFFPLSYILCAFELLHEINSIYQINLNQFLFESS